jgi:transcriptional regulator with XRE-family HTH domain
MEKRKISTFKDWLAQSGMNMYAFSKFANMPPSTIGNLVNGKPVIALTVRKLIKLTKDFPIPLTFDMFPRVFMRGTYEIISGPELFKRLLTKSLKLKRSAF